MKKAPFIILLIMLLLSISKFAMAGSSVSCEVEMPKTAQVGKSCTISYSIYGGSGSFSNMRISISPHCNLGGSGSNVGASEYFNIIDISEQSGKCTFIAPPANQASIQISGHDNITGEDFWFPRYLTLELNPDFNIEFSFDEEEYYLGDEISVTYEINGITTGLSNTSIWWAYGRSSYSANFQQNVEEVTTTTGTVSFTPPYGDLCACYIQGTDMAGNVFFSKSKTVYFSSISESDILILPNLLTQIESEAFSGTRIIALEIPESVYYIADDAFTGSRVHLIAGYTEYVRTYALDHGIVFRMISK